MNTILDELKSPTWWLSVVVAGLFVNLLAAYAKTPIDRLLSGASSRWRAKSSARRAGYERFIQLLAESAANRYEAVLYEFRMRLNTILICVTLTGMIVVLQIAAPLNSAALIIVMAPLIFASIVTMIICIQYYRRIHNALSEALRRFMRTHESGEDA